MFTTFDKYLLNRLLHTFVVFFVATFGLYLVIDLFSNVDDFQRDNRTLSETAFNIARYYGFRAFEFFGMAGPILVVVSAASVFGLLEKKSESHPILAAGIPASRLLRPVVVAGILLNLLLIANQELILPRFAVQLQTPRGAESAQTQKVEPVYDYFNFLMHIDGEQVVIEDRKLVGASFNLTPELARQIHILKAESAIYLAQTDTHPAGWLLQNLTSPFDADLLTDLGQQRIIARDNGRDVFIESPVSFDQLYNRGRNLKLLSSAQLVKRIRNPSTGIVPLRSQSLALHSRITQPILSLISLTMALPLVMRRESRSLIMNMTLCAGVLGVCYIVAQGSLMLGGTGLVRADFAAWFPVVATGSASVWTWGYIQT